jgi:hypothetical protein
MSDTAPSAPSIAESIQRWERAVQPVLDQFSIYTVNRGQVTLSINFHELKEATGQLLLATSSYSWVLPQWFTPALERIEDTLALHRSGRTAEAQRLASSSLTWLRTPLSVVKDLKGKLDGPSTYLAQSSGPPPAQQPEQAPEPQAKGTRKRAIAPEPWKMQAFKMCQQGTWTQGQIAEMLSREFHTPIDQSQVSRAWSEVSKYTGEPKAKPSRESPAPKKYNVDPQKLQHFVQDDAPTLAEQKDSSRPPLRNHMSIIKREES